MGVVGDESRLDIFALALLAEDFVDEFSFAHRVVDLDAEIAGSTAQCVLVHHVDIDAGVLEDGLAHGDALVGGLEVNDVVADFDGCRAVDVEAYLLEHLLGEVHHPVIILIADVDLHAGELGIVGAVHSLVAEILRELINPLETAYDEAFQIELVGDAQVERYVESVVVGYERTGRSAPRNRLEYGGLDLHIAVAVEIGAHRVVDFRALDENLLDAVIDNEVDIAAAVAQLGVIESVVGDAVFYLDDRQRTQRLAQDCQGGCVNRDLARLCAEHEAFHTDKVADVEQLLEHDVIKVFVFAGAQLVAVYIDLNTACGVLKFHERGLSHYAAAHYSARYRHLAARSVVRERTDYFVGVARHGIFGGRVGVDAHIAQLLQRIAANNLLFAKFEDIHE